METGFRRFLLRGETVFVSIAMIIMVGALSLQVTARFAFEMALTWTDEIALFSLIWVSLIGAAIVIETRSAHLIDFFVKKFPAVVQRLISGAVFIVLLGTCWVLIKYGYDFTLAVHNQRSSVLGIRISYIYMSLPISALLMGTSLLMDWRYYLVPDLRPSGGAV
jgi:TRAP-type C4-dicarboxylate transport system permease small subunit